MAALPADPAPEKAAPPVLDIGVKNGQIQVRWTVKEVTYTAIALRAAFEDGGLSLSGVESEKVRVELSGKRPPSTRTADGKVVAVEPPAPGKGLSDPRELSASLEVDPMVISLTDGKVVFPPPVGGKPTGVEPPVRKDSPPPGVEKK